MAALKYTLQRVSFERQLSLYFIQVLEDVCRVMLRLKSAGHPDFTNEHPRSIPVHNASLEEIKAKVRFNTLNLNIYKQIQITCVRARVCVCVCVCVCLCDYWLINGKLFLMQKSGREMREAWVLFCGCTRGVSCRDMMRVTGVPIHHTLYCIPLAVFFLSCSVTHPAINCLESGFILWKYTKRCGWYVCTILEWFFEEAVRQNW